MTLKPGDKSNFETLRRAQDQGDLALVESRCAKTGEYRALVCAMGRSGADITTYPLAQMITGNPYEDYLDPTMPDLPEASGGGVHLSADEASAVWEALVTGKALVGDGLALEAAGQSSGVKPGVLKRQLAEVERAMELVDPDRLKAGARPIESGEEEA